MITDVQSLDGLAEGSAIVLAPRPEDADWLNQRRQLFAERKLKVVLWCDEATTIALARSAPDLYDWIGHRQTCSPGPAPFAVTGMRAAFQMEWPVSWSGTPTTEAVLEVVRAALPGERTLDDVSGALEYTELLSRMRARVLLLVDIGSERQLRRARWAHAEARRGGRLILVVRELDCPGFWPVHDRFEDLRKARSTLLSGGFNGASGRLAALLDLEAELIAFVNRLRKGGDGSAALEAAAADFMDPAEGLSRLLPADDQPWLEGEAWRMRAFAGRPRARAIFDEWIRAAGLDDQKLASPRSKGVWAAHASSDVRAGWLESPALRSWAVEATLRRGPEDGIVWIALAIAAFSFGERGVAKEWLVHALQCPLGAETTREITRIIDETLPPFKGELSAILHPALMHDLRRRAETAHRIAVGLSGLAMLVFLTASVTALVTWTAGWLLNSWILGGTPLLFVGAGIAGMVAKAAPDPSLREDVRFIEQQAVNTTRVSSYLKEAALVSSDAPEQARSRVAEAESLASKTLGKEHPLSLRAAEMSASMLLEARKGREALELLAPLLTTDSPFSNRLALLTCKALAEAGRAGDALHALAHLLQVSLADPVSVVPKPAPMPASGEDGIVSALLQRPGGSLAGDPEAHLACVDALLKQGRYPEALQMTRGAITSISGPTAFFNGEAIRKLRARLVDLERRLGPSA